MSVLRLEELLKEKGIGITELANRLNVGRQTVYYYIKQDDKNPISQLQKIADAIDVNLVDLFPEKKSETIGFIKYDGHTDEVNSLMDVENFINKTKLNYEMPIVKFIDEINSTYYQKEKIESLETISTNDELCGVIHTLRTILDNMKFERSDEINSFFTSTILIFNNLNYPYWEKSDKGGLVGDSYYNVKMDLDIRDKQDTINQLYNLWLKKHAYSIEFSLRGIEAILSKNHHELGGDIIQMVIKLLTPLIVKAEIRLISTP